MTDKITLSRRDGLKGLLAISAVGALAACKQREASGNASNAQLKLKYASENAFFSAQELAVLSAVAQTIIPKTETAGAIEAGVPETIQTVISTWGEDNDRLYWREGLSALDAELSRLGGQSFEKTSEAQRFVTLKEYDNQVFSGDVTDAFYRDMKKTVGRAYYMSEPGATEELQYDPVPGEFRGDVLFSEIGKAWAT